jgi:Fe-S-cluster containining protein
MSTLHEDAGLACRACGACCAYSAEWPRFSLEDDATLARIPDRYVHPDHNGMRCIGDRCAALVGEVGTATTCAVYDVRPEVCRACTIGDDACTMARQRFGLERLADDDARRQVAGMDWLPAETR